MGNWTLVESASFLSAMLEPIQLSQPEISFSNITAIKLSSRGRGNVVSMHNW